MCIRDSSIFAENSVSISGGQVTTISGGDAGIFTPGSVSITDGSDVDASGYWPAIRGNGGVTMTGSTVAAESSNDVAIYSPQNVSIADSIVEAKGVEGCLLYTSRAQKRPSQPAAPQCRICAGAQRSADRAALCSTFFRTALPDVYKRQPLHMVSRWRTVMARVRRLVSRLQYSGK